MTYQVVIPARWNTCTQTHTHTVYEHRGLQQEPCPVETSSCSFSSHHWVLETEGDSSCVTHTEAGPMTRPLGVKWALMSLFELPSGIVHTCWIAVRELTSPCTHLTLSSVCIRCLGFSISGTFLIFVLHCYVRHKCMKHFRLSWNYNVHICEHLQWEMLQHEHRQPLHCM